MGRLCEDVRRPGYLPAPGRLSCRNRVGIVLFFYGAGFRLELSFPLSCSSIRLCLGLFLNQFGRLGLGGAVEIPGVYRNPAQLKAGKEPEWKVEWSRAALEMWNSVPKPVSSWQLDHSLPFLQAFACFLQKFWKQRTKKIP